MSKKSEEVSKLISYWLRHNPTDGQLIADDFGWVNLTDTRNALKIRGFGFSEDDLLQLNSSFDKIRWEIDLERNKIRATHGHSYPVLLDEKIEIPPDILYHGTALSNIGSIIKNGLAPMNRQFVHLTTNIEIALVTARRYGKPVMIEVDAKRLRQQGAVFYHTSENVWLTKEIDPAYLAFEPWQTTNSEEKSILLKELIKEMPHTHLLKGKTENLEVIMRRYDCDDCLFIDNKNGEAYIVHLTWAAVKESDPKYPGTTVFESLTDFFNSQLVLDQNDWYNI